MRKTFLLLLFLPLSAFATTRYVAQTAGTFSGGTACNGQTAITVATFNSTTLSAGDVTYLCGTLTASAGASNFITIAQSGTSGNPISLIFDSGATVTATYWSGPVINIEGQSYITINGQTAGVIQATANGSALANQQDHGECVSNGSPGGTSVGVTVENLTCSDLYVENSVSDNGGENTYCFDLWNLSSLQVTGNVCHDAKWALRTSLAIGDTFTNVLTYANNDVYNIDHGYFNTDSNSGGTATASGWYIYGNTFGSMANWDNSADNNHHDWLHFSTNSTTTRFSGIYIYNNKFEGDVGSYANAGIFFQPQTQAAYASVYIFNNVVENTATATHCFANGLVSDFGVTSPLITNNDFWSLDSGGCTNNGNTLPGDNGIDYASSELSWENNVTYGTLQNYIDGDEGGAITAINYNDYYNGANWWFPGSGQTASFSTWKTDCACDGSSLTSNPLLNGSFVPQSGSPLISAGVNLYSTCNGQPNPGLGALCDDASGNARPSSGAWTIGAYNYQASGPTIGGPTAASPFPNQVGSNLVTNPTFATSLSGWTANSCVSWDGTTTHTADGSGSAKLTCTAGGTITALQQTVTVGTAQEGDSVTAWVKTDTNFNGLFTITFFDDTHGDGTYLAQAGQTMEQVTVGSTTWVQIGTSIFPYEFLHGGDSFNFRINVVGQTAGNAWVDDVSVTDTWKAIRNFVTSSQENGFVWTDEAPLNKNYAGLGLDINPSPSIGQIAGVAEVTPPYGDTLSQLTLTETITSDSGCADVLGTKTYASPAAKQVWSFASTDYGGIPSVGTSYYVCSKLNVTSGGALVDTYPAFQVIFENSTFRTALNNYFDIDSAFIHKGKREYVLGAYDRLSGTNRCSVCLWSAGTGCTPHQSTAEACYQLNEQGPGRNNVAPQSQVLTGGPGNIYSYAAAKFNVTMSDIIGMSTVCPSVSGICTGDELSPWLDAEDSVGIAHMQIVNNWYHCLTTNEPATPCPAPTFVPTVTIGAGSITASSLYLKYTEVAWNYPGGSASFPTPLESNPSSALTENLSGATCAGTNCSVSFTTPACVNGIQQGGYIYASTDGVNYYRQYPTVSGLQFAGLPTPCGTAVTLSSLQTTGASLVAAPISSISRTSTTVSVTVSTGVPWFKGACVQVSGVTDSTDFPNVQASITAATSQLTFTYTQSGTATSSSGGTATLVDCTNSSSPTWQGSTTTDQTVWSTIATTMLNSATGAHLGNGGFYPADEPLLTSIPTVFTQRQYLDVNASPLWCTLVDATGTFMWRDECDIINNDPYPFGIAADPDDIAALPGFTSNSCNAYSTQNAIISASDCFPQRVPIWVDEIERETYGVRPVWSVLQLFTRGSFNAFPYALDWQQAVEAIIAQKEWDNVGGIVWWGWVSSSGMEQAWFTDGDTQALSDLYQADSQISALSPILLSPTADSPIMNAASGTVSGTSGEQVTGGQIVSNVQTSATTSSLCGSASIYNTANYPFGPVDWFSANYMPANTNLVDSFIFTHNYCQNGVTVTFGLPSVPSTSSVEVLYEGRTLSISTSGCPNSTPACFTDTWNGLDVHIYAIKQPRGALIH